MDWRDHIVAPGEPAGLARRFLHYTSEEFLVTLANKGVYKRAVKDCGSVEACTLEQKGDMLSVAMDDVTVTLDTDVAKSKCTCPSKTVCKHIIMALLFTGCYASSRQEEGAASEEADAGNEPETPAGEAFAELKHVDFNQLKKEAGKRLFEDTLRQVRDGWRAEFTEKDMLSAFIPMDQMTVFFPREDSIRRAVCKCGSASLCRHKLLAILSYASESGELPEEEEQRISLLEESTLALLQTADRFAVSVLEKGILCCGVNDVQDAAQLSVRLEGERIGNLARLFHSLATDLDNMLGKNAAFHAPVTFSTLSRLHNTMSLLLKNPNDPEMISSLVENSRSEYFTTPFGTFMGLGAYPWQTRSGFFGITAYLYYQERQQVCTYTASMADYYENTAGYSSLQNLEQQFRRNEHWDSMVSLKYISSGRFTLGNFKSNQLNRLSSGKQTACITKGKTDAAAVMALPVAVDLAQWNPKANEYRYFQKRTPDTLAAIEVQAAEDVQFNKTDQVLSFYLVDEDGNRAYGEIPYSELNENALAYMERMGKTLSKSTRVFICIDRGRYLQPISAVTEKGVDSFYFDR